MATVRKGKNMRNGRTSNKKRRIEDEDDDAFEPTGDRNSQTMTQNVVRKRKFNQVSTKKEYIKECNK